MTMGRWMTMGLVVMVLAMPAAATVMIDQPAQLPSACFAAVDTCEPGQLPPAAPAGTDVPAPLVASFVGVLALALAFGRRGAGLQEVVF
ncbi:hypothetical protein CHU93_04385 [Sandarakinorhabdus cyanobacteriorum]|uniref:VPEID-CTERM sorting domain-containing protein n=2 Tax=Sandarakinorhabdus cyanobacteriorum TaxID=1981098 RepID=A0A255YPY2_9SPHN|nr:hypothetical protein CHU93_04385 [Sandarakinorhabdus cyanobacteriorum]